MKNKNGFLRKAVLILTNSWPIGKLGNGFTMILNIVFRPLSAQTELTIIFYKFFSATWAKATLAIVMVLDRRPQ